jgi:hypothetical protein
MVAGSKLRAKFKVGVLDLGKEVSRKWRKLHNKKRHNLCSSTIITIIIRGWDWHRGDMSAYNTLVGKPEGKKPTRETGAD